MRCVVLGAEVRVGKPSEVKGQPTPEYGALFVVDADAPRVQEGNQFIGCSVRRIETLGSHVAKDVAELLKQNGGPLAAYCEIDIQRFRAKNGGDAVLERVKDIALFDDSTGGKFKFTTAGVDFLEKKNVLLQSLRTAKRAPVAV